MTRIEPAQSTSSDTASSSATVPFFEPLIASRIIPIENLNQLREKWGNDITMVLMATPFIEQHISKAHPLNEIDYLHLDKAALKLTLQKNRFNRANIYNNMLELQSIANTELGHRYNFSTWTDLRTILLASLQQIINALEYERDKSVDSITDLTRLIEKSPIDTLSPEQLQDIENRINRCTQQLSKTRKSQRSILRAFSEQVCHIKFKLIKERCYHELKLQLANLALPGSMRERAGEFQLGASAGAGDLIKLLSGKFGVLLRFHTVTLDDGLIRPAYYCTPKLSFSFGEKKIAKGSVSAAYEGKWSGKAIRTVDHFVDIYAHELMPLPPAMAPRIKTRSVRSALRHATRQEQRAISSKQALTTLLKNQGVLSTGDQITIDPLRLPGYAFLSHQTHGIKGLRKTLGITTLNGIIGGQVAHAEVINNYNRYVDLIHAANQYDDFFDVHQSERPTLRALTERTERLSFASDNRSSSINSGNSHGTEENSIRTAESLLVTSQIDLKHALLDLHNTFCDYCELINEYDTLKSTIPKTEPISKQIKQLRQKKHKAESDRDTNGRGQYIRSLITEHLHLKKLYQNLFDDSLEQEEDDSDFSRLLKEFEHHYQQPNIYLNAVKHVQGQLSATITADSIHTFALARVHFNLEPIAFAHCSITPEIERLTIENYINPDLDGTYLKVRIKVRAGIDIPTLLPFIDPTRFLLSDTETIDQFDQIDWSSFATPLEGDAVLEFSWHQHGPVDAYIKSDDKSHWHLMYIRLLAGGKIGGSLQGTTGPLLGAAQVNAKLGVHVHRLDNVVERIGDNSLRYLQSKHNGWALGMQTSGENNLWQAYKDKKIEQFKRLFHQASNDNNNIALEVKQRCGDVNRNLSGNQKDIAITKANSLFDTTFRTANEIGENFLQQCQQLKSDPSEENTIAAFNAFDIFLTLQSHETNARAAARFSLKK